jgi:hypothetical protein
MAISSLSETLKSQNDQLVDISKGIGSINTSFTKWFDVQDRQRLQDLEKERDEKASAEAVKTAVVNGSTSSKKSAGSKSGGMFGGGMKGLGASLGIGGIFAKGGLMKGAGIFGLSQLMAGSIGNAIANLTGDSDLAAAAANIVKFAGVGALFGKKFALLGAVAGALATEENKQALSDIGDSLGERGKQIKDALLGMGIQLPKLSDVYATIGEVSNEILNGINGLINMDIKAITSNMTGVNAAAGMGLAALHRKGKSPLPDKTNPLTKGNRIALNNERANKLSPKQVASLNKQGITVDKGGLKKGGKFISADAGDKALKSVKAPTSAQSKGLMASLKKYKNFAKFAKVPLIGTALSLGNIGMILANPDIKEDQKMAEIAGALGSISGGTLGAIAGAAMGAPIFGVGAIGGGILGGILGAFSGDYLAQELATWMLGGDSEIANVAKSLKDSGGASGTSAQTAANMTNAFAGLGTPNASRIVPLDGATIKDAGAASDMLNGSRGQGSVGVLAPIQNNSTSNSSNTNLVGSILSTTDFNDLAGTRTA